MKLIYASCPARLTEKKEEIMRYVESQGCACLHPFNALPYEFFEGGSIGRQTTLELCCKLVKACDEFWLFGISEGCLTELEYFFANGGSQENLKIMVREFDPEHETYAEKLKDRFSATLARIALTDPA